MHFSPRHTRFGTQVNPRSHSAKPLLAAVFSGCFPNTSPELPIPTLSHDNNCSSLFARDLKRHKRNEWFSGFERTGTSARAGSCSSAEGEGDALAQHTKLSERERSGREAPGPLLAAWKELPPGSEDFCLPNKAAGVKNASDAAASCRERREKSKKRKKI